MKDRFWIYFTVITACIIFATTAYSALDKDKTFSGPDFEAVVVTEKGEQHKFHVELATDSVQQSRGLMYRTEMPQNVGMLFLFDSEAKRSFWMRNTYIPLDMIFIESDGRIQHVHSMAKPQDDSHITSPGRFRAVLEINGGLTDKMGIKPGQYVFNPAFKNMHLLDDSKKSEEN